MGIIYKLTSPSGMSYVGQTVQQLNQRLGAHRCRSRCYAIGAAIKKYGLKAFIVEVLMKDVPTDELDEAEDACIVEHNTLKPHGYNLVRGRPEPGKQVRYERFRVIAKEFSNTESFRQQKRDMWKDPEWRESWRAVWMEKRREKLSKLSGQQRRNREHEYVRADRTVARRIAKKDPEKWAQWQVEHSKEAGMLKKHLTLQKKMYLKAQAMSPEDAHKYLEYSRAMAIKKTRKTKATRTLADVEKWYPVPPCAEEIRAMRAQGPWPNVP